MTEWLTTGEMIDRLKVGEVAEPQEGNKAERVLKNENGFLVWEDGQDGVVRLNRAVIDTKWRILPKYVTFEEAMKALKEGKMINFHHENSKINAHKELHPVWFKNYQWNDLLEGNWTIEE